MSTKIYNGYIIHSELSSYEIGCILKKIKTNVDIIATRMRDKQFVNVAVTYFDDVSTGYSEYKQLETPFYYSGMQQQKAEQELKKGLRNPLYDYEVIINFYPLKKKTLLTINTEHIELANAVLNSYHRIKYYGYWNNTDPDKNCSEKEWYERETNWNKIFKCYTSIYFQTSFKDYIYKHTPKENLFEFIPTFDKRLERQTSEFTIIHYIKKAQENENISNEKMHENFHIVMNAILKVNSRIENRDQEVIKDFNKYKEHLKFLMKKELTIKDLETEITHVF
ncbi:MAG: hypothetical protein PHF86_03170 [Candidatus Nanoarchaeia archaeon]|jgi:hypothetical protein|nr:hypothetical protein [Candidatus Nanoarchaeia archaeon]